MPRKRRNLHWTRCITLNTTSKDKVKGTTAAVALQQLEHERETLKDDFTLNQIARKQFRDRKRLAMEAADKDHKLMSRLSLLGSDVHLLPEDEGDLHTAKMMRLTYTKRGITGCELHEFEPEAPLNCTTFEVDGPLDLRLVVDYRCI
ncbi:hypothetical protein AHF37_10490 [Paragonimus kellicotti]|nr:hypothetical protein AHF37_10490 [Paragonimus kellicotti]